MVKEKKNHLLQMMRKYKRYFALWTVAMSPISALGQPYLLELQARWSKNSLLFRLCTVPCAIHPLIEFWVSATTLMTKSYKYGAGREGERCPLA